MDVSDIFYFFRLEEGEEGVRGARGGGGRFFIKNPTRGGGFPGGRGARIVSAATWRTGGGGAKYFFFGPETSTKTKLGRY